MNERNELIGQYEYYYNCKINISLENENRQNNVLKDYIQRVYRVVYYIQSSSYYRVGRQNRYVQWKASPSFLQVLLEASATVVHINSNDFVGLVIVNVELFQSINTRLGVGLAVVLLVFELFSVVIVRHVGCRHYHVFLQQSKPVGAHLKGKTFA